MKKVLSAIAILVFGLSACGTPTTSSLEQTPTSTSMIDPTWKIYTNEQVGFSVRYPANWQEQDLPDDDAGQQHHIGLQGPEGGAEFIWGTGLGGACPEGYQQLDVAKGSLPACHTQRDDGTDLWSLAGQTLGDIGFTGFIYTNDTSEKSKAVVLQVISTLSFP